MANTHNFSPLWITGINACRRMIQFAQLMILLIACFPSHVGFGQSYEGLTSLSGSKIKTYFSVGAAPKAERMAAQLDRVIAFYNQHLGFTPSVTVLILSKNDWSNYTTFPVYGMPHYNAKDVLIVASEDNEYWKSMVPPPEEVPAEIRQKFMQVYTNQKGELTMEPFFDLLVIHELGHAFHQQGGLLMQRKWMGELFCNILLHSYIAENEPALLDALTMFPEMVVATTERSELTYTTLEELESNYDYIGKSYPQNYGWYQCRWHVAAGKIYDNSKLVAIKNLWRTLKEQRETLDDGSLAALLSSKVDENVSAVPLTWDDSK